jgi:hypothetical protein
MSFHQLFETSLTPRSIDRQKEKINETEIAQSANPKTPYKYKHIEQPRLCLTIDMATCASERWQLPHHRKAPAGTTIRLFRL